MRVIRDRFGLAFWSLVITVAFGLGMRAAPAFAELDSGPPAEVGAMQGEVEKMKAAIDNLTQELERIKQLVSQRPSSPPRLPEVMAHVSTSGNPMLGNPEAPLTLIEFSDYQCPYCRRFFEATLPVLKTEYIDTGKLRYIFRDFPLDRLHPQARKAAEAAHCAGEQDKYWEMHDLLFQDQKALQVESFKGYARHLDLDATALDDCLKQSKYAAEVQQDLDDGTAAGVQGTPSFFLGTTRSDDAIQGIFIRGAQPIAAFRQAIERLLGKSKDSSY